jgi:hypothetical protein
MQIKPFISPTHKRTEGRAPVWGSEFTSNDATLQGDSAEIARTLNAKLWDLVRGGRELPLFCPILISNLFEPLRTISNLGQKIFFRNFEPAAWGE